ncbi:MAG: hypothetical protein WC379_08930 [Methanoregula sp.]
MQSVPCGNGSMDESSYFVADLPEQQNVKASADFLSCPQESVTCTETIS